MPKKNILFVVRSFVNPAPQSIRFQKISSFLKDEYNIHVLMMHSGRKRQIEKINGLVLHKIPYSKLGKFTQFEGLPSNNTELVIKKKKRIISFLRILRIRKLILPDPLIFDFFRLRHELHDILDKKDIKTVIGSSFPHTTMMLSRSVKRHFSDVVWIHDIGDPMYPNNNGYIFKALYSYFFETYYLKYINKLVVTNKATKNYYISRYKRLNALNVAIIPQGTDLTNKKSDKELSNPAKIVYAGTFYDKFREPYQAYEAINSLKNTVSLDLYGKIALRHLPARNMSNIYYNGPVQHEKIKEILSNSDIILYIDNGAILQTPGKIYEIIAPVKPVVCIYQTMESPSIDFLREVPYVFLCSNHATEISKTIKKILQLIISNSINYTYLLDDHTWKARAISFNHIIKETLPSS